MYVTLNTFALRSYILVALHELWTDKRTVIELIKVVRKTRLGYVLKHLAHLVRAYGFSLPFNKSSFISFSKVKLLSEVIP